MRRLARVATTGGVTAGGAAPGGPVSGFLLRSQAVAGWPNLRITGFSDAERADTIPVVRIDQLSNDTILCLFGDDLVVKNTRATPVTFSPAAVVGETSPAQGSVVYIHLGTLVDQTRVPSIQFTAPDWRFEPLTDARYGSYWAATPALGPVTLAPGEQLTVRVADVAVAARPRAQSRVYFDYYGLTGLDDGVDVAILTVTQPRRGQPATGR